jgi:predicted PurR-regulated permease PerM
MKSHHFLAILLIAASYWMYLLYKPFLLSIIIASLLAISTANIQRRLEIRLDSLLLASMASTLLLALLFFLPLGYFLTAVTIFINSLDVASFETVYDKLANWVYNLPPLLGFIKPYLVQLVEGIDIADFGGSILVAAGKVGSYSAGFLKTAMLIIIFYFFANYNGKAIFNFFKKVVRLPQQDTTLLAFELSSVMSVVFYSIIVTAAFEGALFGIAVAFMGYDGLLFGIMYGFASLIPVVGGVLMWLPFMLYEFSVGNTGAAIFIALYSIIVISIIADTFVKPLIIKFINIRVIKMEQKMNELLIFFAIIAGLSSFGFWGMILGPAITAFFLAMLKLIEQHPENEPLE